MILDILLIAVIVIQQIIHYIERRDMCNRLMAKDFTDYTHFKTPPPKHIPSAHSQTLKKWRNRVGDE